MDFVRSFKFAFRGIAHCIKNERNMRVHIVFATYVLIFSRFYDLSIEKIAILILTISAVLSAEMVNTATEELSDLSAEDYNPMVRIAKDVAAGAVLVTSFSAVFVGIALFWDIESFKAIYGYFLLHKVRFAIFLVSLIFSYLFIHFGISGIKNRMWEIAFIRKQKNQ